MRLFIFGLAVGLCLFPSALPVYANEETPEPKVFKCGPVYRKPGFVTLEFFMERVRSRQEPWNELLMPDGNPDPTELEKLQAPLAEHVSLLYKGRGTAIVRAENQPFRGAPFSAVIFLLSRNGGKYHVTDFLRRSVDIGSEAGIAPPKILKLAPNEYVHFALTLFEGGRRWSFAQHEIYMVRDGHFHQTLQIENGEAYLQGADPYREFNQSLELSVRRGRLAFTVKRTWGMPDESERAQSFQAVFVWDRRRMKFVSPKARQIPVSAPQSWDGAKLPKPPAR